MHNTPDPDPSDDAPDEPAEQTVEYRGFAIHYHLEDPAGGDAAGQAVGGVEPLTDEAWEAWGQLGGSREVTLSGQGAARRAHFFTLARLAIDEALDPPDA